MSLCVAREMVVPMAMEAKAAREVMVINMLTALTITNDITITNIINMTTTTITIMSFPPLLFMFSLDVTKL